MTAKEPHVETLEELIASALSTTNDDTQLAKTLVASGALAEIIRRGTYDEATVQKRLNYASANGIRSALSKARHNKGSFPEPIVEGRRWARTEVEEYRKTKRRTSQTTSRDRARNTSFTSSTSSTSSTVITSNTASSSNAPHGSLRGGTGDVSTTDVHRQDPDQWRKS